MTDKCRSCHEEIVWGTTENGKPVPLDAKPELRLAPRLVFDEAVRPAKGNELRPEDADVRMVMVRVWPNHFVTCKFADQHRSKPSSSPSAPSPTP